MNWIFWFFELVNTAWLIYIVMAQTIGSYQNCKCQTATWSREGEYVDVSVTLKASGHSVEPWWIIGVLLSGLIMFITIAFLVIEWCKQSHLNLVDVDKAIRDLKITQHFKYCTLWIWKFFDYCIYCSKFLWRIFSGSTWNKKHKKANKRESIRWSYAWVSMLGYMTIIVGLLETVSFCTSLNHPFLPISCKLWPSTAIFHSFLSSKKPQIS